MADYHLLPGSIRDDNTKALAGLIDRLGGLDISQVVTNWVDNIDVSALPLLLEQFHVAGAEGGDYAVDSAAQRALIKQSLLLHRTKGTLAAVLGVFERLELTGTVSEWMNYGGDPYHFRVALELGETELSQLKHDNLITLINEYKSFRSRLEQVLITRDASGQTPVYACALTSGEIITINPQE